MYQLKQMADFIEKKTQDIPIDDVVLIAGDFNISSRKASDVLLQTFTKLASKEDKLEKIDDKGENSSFSVFLDPNYDHLMEYKMLLKILTQNNHHGIIDLKSTFADSEGNPVTFGGVDFDEELNKVILIVKCRLLRQKEFKYSFT